MASRFVAATDEVWRLQGGDSPDSKFFQRMANEGHYRAAGGTRQGIYVCSPTGKLLSSGNSLDPQAVVATMGAGLNAWNALPAAERRLPADFAGQRPRRWEDNVPRDGLILVEVNRDLASPTTPTAAR